MEMPVGLVVEGESEYHGIPVIVRRLNCRHSRPAQFYGQSHTMSAKAVANRASKAVRAILRKKVRLVLVVIDRETRQQCAGEFAADVETALRKLVPEGAPIKVVAIDRTFENWLLVDPEGIATHSAIRSNVAKTKVPNADGGDGEQVLKSWMNGSVTYTKGRMAGLLAEHIRWESASVYARSRSLRKFRKEVVGRR